jgi:bacitracin synthase 3
MKPMPMGIPGELYISGIQVARGYLNRQELTAEKFMPNPFGPGERMYKSGDRARWLPDGNIEFLGRFDFQVKIRGFRIELGEIEYQLMKLEDIDEAAVIAREDAVGGEFLCAYAVAGKTLDIPSVKEKLSKRLPYYMLPSYILQLDKIPLTPSGKVDRKALPAPGARETGRYAAPGNEMEHLLADIWSEVLGREKTGIDDNFFEIGGDSIKIILISALLQKQGLNVSVNDFFQHPTIRRLALAVTFTGPAFTAIARVETREYYEVSYNQESMWNFQRRYPGNNSCNLYDRIRLGRDARVSGVRLALRKIMERHEGSRTWFGEVNGRPVQYIGDSVKLPLEIIDLSGSPGEKAEMEAQRIYEEHSRAPFDLTRAPLFRCILVKQGAERWDLILIVHHIISDGWSHEILKKEFSLFYNGFLEGRGIKLEPLKLQYRDFALWQRRLASDPGEKANARRYWSKKLEEGFPVLQLPSDLSGDPENRGGVTFRSVVPGYIGAPLKNLAKSHHTTLFMVLFSAFNLLMFRLSGQRDIVCRVPGAGREQPAVHNIVGNFVSAVIVKNHIGENEEFVDLLHRVAGNILEAWRHQFPPPEQVLEDLQAEYARIKVSFNMLTMRESEAAADLEQPDSFYIEDITDTSFPLTVLITEYRDGMEILWDGQKAFFKPSTLERMARGYLEVLQAITGENSKK